MLLVATTSPSETADLAETLAEHAMPGDVLVLAGDLGAGKTAFSKAYGLALGVKEAMTSPTFTLAREYEGRLTLHHLDVYRLELMAEVMDLDLPDLLDSGGVVLIEWGDAILPMLPPDFLEVRFTFGDGDDDRLIELRPVGRRWSAREQALGNALGVASIDGGI
ncbi:MAG: tRNA (adenosine(37)-N6)-threonylcarbamoyltransferase complex ATPase subunit type 1 TsaE [Acidimicrobiales bacterium]